MTAPEPPPRPTMAGVRRLVSLLAVGLTSSAAWAQQDPQDRLWQGLEQRQIQQREAPAPLKEGAFNRAPDSPLAALTRLPGDRLQQQQLAVLNAVNQRDWFGADRLLRQYARMPGHAATLSSFVTASRAAADREFGTAVQGYEAVLNADPTFTRATLDLARTLYADNRVSDAQAVFDRLRTQALPPEVMRHIDEYQQAIARREQWQGSVSLALVREDNVNSASTVVDPCALVFQDICLTNTPGEKLSATGLYLESSVSKWWALGGHHGLLLRGLVFGNTYDHHDDYDNLVATVYGGYQYASAAHQVQLLPLMEMDLEGGREAYRALGLRAGYSRPVGERAQVETSLEYKARRFAPQLRASLEGNLWSASVFGQYALGQGWTAFGTLMWRESEARSPVFAYRERVGRLGLHRSFSGRFTASVAYARREKDAKAANVLFARRQRDHEDSLALNVSAPGAGWRGLTPTFSYEYRNNRSTVPHAYNYEKHRLTVGLTAVF